MKVLAAIGVSLLILADYVVFGIVFADLWRIVFVPSGLPAIAPVQAAVGMLMLGMVGRTSDTGKSTAEFAQRAVSLLAVYLAVWGVAYLLLWLMKWGAA